MGQLSASMRYSGKYAFTTRKQASCPGSCTVPNAIIEPIHPKPVIPMTDEERDVWLRAVGRSEGAEKAFAG
jgi:hypothetical protein